jgi:16S rRNA (uracil1498-N3)-methyltransferase
MTVHRFFVSPEQAAGDRFPIPPAIERQVRTVLRLRDGDRVVLLTGDGLEATCRLEAGDCIVEERCASAGEPAHRLTVVQALLKGDGLETVIQQGTEVGVAAFRLAVTERCVARELSPRKLERLRAIAREAAEQSERGLVPAVDAPLPLADAIASGDVLLAERVDAPRLRDVVTPSTIVIGPEGGFTPAEMADAANRGLTLVGLGPRILRSQTVAAAVAAAVLSRSGDFA